jgi:putative ABC transport system permease protein
MKSISIFSLLFMLLPFAVVIVVQFVWNVDYKKSLYALLRMIIQLLLIGYILLVLFEIKNSFYLLLALLFMLVAASVISLNHNKNILKQLFFSSLLSLFVGSFLIMLVTFVFVLELEPWYQPRYTIPLSGMIFANSMNAISLATDRYLSEIKNQKNYQQARNKAYKAALIPITNSFFAVGIVSVPGMMTGAVLSGESSLIAAKYQILIMLMLFSSAGISCALFLKLLKNVSLKIKGTQLVA